MSFRDVMTEDLRLRVLLILRDAPDYTLPEMALRDALDMVGHRVALDRVAAESAWLHDLGLVLRLPVGQSAIVTLSGRGLDIAHGRASVPGIARPRPGV